MTELFGNSYDQRQELFDSQASLDTSAITMLCDFEELWNKHRISISKNVFTKEYHSDLFDLSVKHDVKYALPKFRGGLTAVPASNTVH